MWCLPLPVLFFRSFLPFHFLNYYLFLSGGDNFTTFLDRDFDPGLCFQYDTSPAVCIASNFEARSVAMELLTTNSPSYGVFVDNRAGLV